MERPQILILNGSPLGRDGNSAHISALLEAHIRNYGESRRINLSDEPSRESILAALTWANGFLFVTGTYWDSWGSPLQRFFEEFTDTEASGLWIGKAAGAVVSCHAVGGKGVLSRLFGVLSTFGVLIPPFGGLVLSLANQLAIEGGDPRSEDLWRFEDLQVLVHNICEATQGGKGWQSWPVERTDYQALWADEWR